ncbi:MAG: hypothetical protein PVI30_27800 [Myxococcales bacterium]
MADHYFERELPRGYGWVFPEVDGLANAGVYLREDEYRACGRDLRGLLDDFLARHPERFGHAHIEGKVRSWSLPIGPVPGPAAGPGLLLVGDAGGFIDPLSGEGIWQALFTGMAAGRTAAAARGFGLTPQLVAEYDAECERAIRRPSRAKAATQAVMRRVVGAGLYRLPPLMAGLRWAYRRRSFEMTKA